PAGRKVVALWEPPPLPGRAPDGGAVGPGAPDGSWVPDPWEPPDDEGPGAAAGALTEEPARRTATAESADLLADLTVAGARALAFTRSRRGAESVALSTRGHLAEVDPELAGQVAAYRGGFLPEERRSLEEGIRTGALRALATTNALELGVDISGLDAVLIVGWPGTRMSIWQQAGRAGQIGRASCRERVEGAQDALPLDETEDH